MTIYEIEDICNLLKIGKSTAYELVRKKRITGLQNPWNMEDNRYFSV